MHSCSCSSAVRRVAVWRPSLQGSPASDRSGHGEQCEGPGGPWAVDSKVTSVLCPAGHQKQCRLPSVDPLLPGDVLLLPALPRLVRQLAGGRAPGTLHALPGCRLRHTAKGAEELRQKHGRRNRPPNLACKGTHPNWSGPRKCCSPYPAPCLVTSSSREESILPCAASCLPQLAPPWHRGRRMPTALLV